MIKQLLLFLFFISLTACPGSQSGNHDNREADAIVRNAGGVTVLCRCDKGGEGKSSVSWSGSDRTLAEAMIKRNCESIQGSVSDCKVIN